LNGKLKKDEKFLKPNEKHYILFETQVASIGRLLTPSAVQCVDCNDVVLEKTINFLTSQHQMS